MQKRIVTEKILRIYPYQHRVCPVIWWVLHYMLRLFSFVFGGSFILYRREFIFQNLSVLDGKVPGNLLLAQPQEL